MSYNGKNYMEQGGDKWVIGGTLEIKEGASVTGLPAAEVPQAANQADSVAEDVSTLVSDFNGLLAKLKAEGYALYVATSKPEVTAMEVLEHFDLAEYFDRICGASLSQGRETKEDVITYLLDQIGEPGQVVMVGDTDYDVIGAKAHGIDTIGVTWGYGQRESMQQAGAVALADTPEALHALLTRRFQDLA